MVAFTYLFLSRFGDTAPRIVAAPGVFGPVVILLLMALAVRVWADAARPTGGATLPETTHRSPCTIKTSGAAPP